MTLFLVCKHGNSPPHQCRLCDLDELTRARKRITELEKQKDGAYSERNKCVALLAKMAMSLGMSVGVGEHPALDVDWEHDWRTILFIDLPAGQVSWHFHDSEKPLLAGIPPYPGKWDGHSTEEKYQRCAAYAYDDRAAKQALRIERLERESSYFSHAFDIGENRIASLESQLKEARKTSRLVFGDLTRLLTSVEAARCLRFLNDAPDAARKEGGCPANKPGCDGNGFEGPCLHIASEAQKLRAENERLKKDYFDACHCVAEMHGAAVGKFGGAPRRGVVEDVQDLRAENERLKEQFADEVFQHAACLSIAEGAPGWQTFDAKREAGRAVQRLRAENERLKEERDQLKAENEQLKQGPAVAIDAAVSAEREACAFLAESKFRDPDRFVYEARIAGERIAKDIRARGRK